MNVGNKFVSAEEKPLKNRRLSNREKIKLNVSYRNQYLLKQEQWQKPHYHNIPQLEAEQMKAWDSQNLGNQV